MTNSDRGPLGRAWDAWCGFWFRPADPTPLCLMRIVAGMLTLYVHIAYCLDLEAFFGSKAWYDRPLAERAFREYPIFLPPDDPDKPPEFFPMPSSRELRATLRTFLDNINRKPENLRVLDLFRGMPPDNTVRLEVMRYIRSLPLEFGERDAALTKMVLSDPADEATARIPEWVRSQPRGVRESLKSDIHRFYEVMPAGREPQLWMWVMLELWQPRAVEQLKIMVQKFDQNYPDPADRAKAYDYLVHWGVPPYRTYAQGHRFYSPFYYIDNPRVLWLVHSINLIAIFLFTIGFCTRVTSVLTWLAALSYLQRNPIILFGQDTMMNLCLFYLMLAPCGAVWSVDSLIARYRAARRSLADGRRPANGGPTPSVSAGFVIRLLQVHYCLMYLSAGLSKLKGNSWWNGTAPWFTMNNPEFSPVHISFFRDFLTFLCQHRWLWEAYMSFGVVYTLVVEIGFPFCVWTRLRPLFIAGAIVLHTMIAINMGLIVFSLFMSALLLAWMTPESVRRVFARPPASLPKLRMRFSSRSEPECKAASLVHAVDVWDQVEFQEGGDGVEFIGDRGGQSGPAGLRECLRTLSLTRPWAWILGPLVSGLAGRWFASDESRKPISV